MIITSDVITVQSVWCLLLNCLPSLPTCFVIFEYMYPSQVLLNLLYNETKYPGSRGTRSHGVNAAYTEAVNAVFGHIVSSLKDVVELFDLLGHAPASSGSEELGTAYFHCVQATLHDLLRCFVTLL